MMKKRGFTLIELAVTFSLISVIIVMLFQLIISLRELYIKGDLQTTMLSKQGILIQKINHDLNEYHLKNITSCGNFCITLHFQTGTAYNLSIDIDNKSIQYHNYIWKLPDGSKFGTVETKSYEDEANNDTINGILRIEIPVSHRLLEKDYGLSVIYQYNSSNTIIPKKIAKPAGITDEQHNQYSFFR